MQQQHTIVFGLCTKAIVCLCVLASVLPLHAGANKNSDSEVRKISVLESNNYLIDTRYKQLFLPRSPQSYEMRELKEFTRPWKLDTAKSDVDFFTLAMNKVCLAWEHSPVNEAPQGATSVQVLRLAQAGARYRCQEYAQVLTDILTAYGHVSRLIQIWKADAAYSAPGGAHVLVEAWSSSLQKWIQLDPQWGILTQLNNVPTNIYEVAEARKQQRWSDVTCTTQEVIVSRENKTQTEYTTEYKEFLNDYFGFLVTVEMVQSTPRLVALPLEGEHQYLTFQGMPIGGQFFTDSFRNFYFALNQATIAFDYTSKSSWSEIFSQYNINDDESYMRNMPKFAAKPNYLLSFVHSMPWFKSFEVKIDNGTWQSISGDTYNWDLLVGTNIISVRPVNIAGVRGSATTMKIAYGTKQELENSSKSK